ncbi:MAG: hypothetical protein JRI36_11130 [Deltaproteobacteria bacterium]|nr:hypothetical protein [Deltaproteobacteria bacterium]
MVCSSFALRALHNLLSGQSGGLAERRYANELARPFARLSRDHIALREDDLTAGRPSAQNVAL